jgi:hypothetical protein
MNRLPTEGVPGTHMDDVHCIAAADHARANPHFVPTPAQQRRIERGEELLQGRGPRSLG